MLQVFARRVRSVQENLTITSIQIGYLYPRVTAPVSPVHLPTKENHHVISAAVLFVSNDKLASMLRYFIKVSLVARRVTLLVAFGILPQNFGRRWGPTNAILSL